MPKIMLNGVDYSAPVASGVSGVKGNAESSYRTGQVNLTPANIGLGNVNNTTDAEKNVASASRMNLPRVTENPSNLDSYQNASLVSKEFAPVGDAIQELPSENYFHILTGKSADENYATQLALGMTVGELYYRNMYNGIWSEWKMIFNSGNIGDVAPSDIGAARKDIYGDTFVSMGRKAGTTVGDESFAFGYNTTASGSNSHAEGYGTTASGSYTHVEGYGTTAESDYSHTEGYYTKAENVCSHACGKYNYNASNYGSITDQVGDAFIIGNGTSSSNRSNVFRVMYDGNIYGKKAFQSSGADYAEFIKPWADGNPEDEDRVGYFVTVKDGLLYKANEGDYIYGITSGNPSIVGNADEDYYWRYERDKFNRIVMEDVPEMVQLKDEEGNPVFDEETHEPVMVETGNIIPNARMKLAEGYNPSLQESYIERKDRKEWDYVGMLGVLPVRDDGTCLPDHYCKCGQGGIATFAAERGFDTYMVIERISDNIVSVILR